jgi:hypothetical protein
MNNVKKLEKILIGFNLKEEAYYISKLAQSELDEKNRIEQAKQALSSVMSAGTFMRSVVPEKIAKIPSHLTSFCSSNGRGDVRFASNGELRNLTETLKGGAARDPGSYHALGLAHDLIILTPKNNNKYSGIGENTEIIKKDPGLVELMSKYAEENNLTWGGKFKRGNSFKLPSGQQVFDMELHHFEIPKSEAIQYINANIKKAMEFLYLGDDLLKSSSGRQKIYRTFLSVMNNSDYKIENKKEEVIDDKNEFDLSEQPYDEEEAFDEYESSQEGLIKLLQSI